MTDATPRIWVLLGHRRGDNNQLLALAEALGTAVRNPNPALQSAASACIVASAVPTQAVSLRPRQPRERLRPPWPDLVIGIGRRSVAGRALDQGDERRPDQARPPRQSARRPEPVRPGHHHAAISGGRRDATCCRCRSRMSRYREPPAPTDEEADWLDALPRPHLLLALGGPTRYWQLTSADRCGGAASGDAAGSRRVADRRRQPAHARDIAGGDQAMPARLSTSLPTEPSLSRCCSPTPTSIFVTGDSVSMISEAVLTGKPVGLDPDRARRRRPARARQRGLSDSTPRPPPLLGRPRRSGLVGTVDRPVSRHSRRSGRRPRRRRSSALLGDRVE